MGARVNARVCAHVCVCVCVCTRMFVSVCECLCVFVGECTRLCVCASAVSECRGPDVVFQVHSGTWMRSWLSLNTAQTASASGGVGRLFQHFIWNRNCHFDFPEERVRHTTPGTQGAKDKVLRFSLYDFTAVIWFGLFPKAILMEHVVMTLVFIEERSPE